MRLLILLALAGCTSLDAGRRRDWVAVDTLIREAHWRVKYCAEPNSEKCDALWLVREELEAVIQATREAFEKTHQAELERLAP